jgi:hypothetical protein
LVITQSTLGWGRKKKPIFLKNEENCKKLDF